MAWPKYYDNDWKLRNPLKYRMGAEPLETLVIYASAVTADSDGRRLLLPGTVLCEITSGDGDAKYGPYSKTASDGRQTIGASVQTYVLLEGVDVTLGDLPCAGLWALCVFDSSTVEESSGISHADLSTLKTAFPNAEWK
jgi:hypothetical protein